MYDFTFSVQNCTCTCACRKACQDTHTSHLVRAPNSRSGGHEFESPLRQELGALTKSGKTFGARSFYSGDHDVMSEHVAGVITWSCQTVWLCNTSSLAHHWQTHLPDATAELRNARSLARHWQTHLPGRITCPTPLLYIRVQYPNVVLEGAM